MKLIEVHRWLRWTLTPQLSDQGLHHIPIVDNEDRLVGMVTQSDLIAVLYRGRLINGDAKNITD